MIAAAWLNATTRQLINSTGLHDGGSQVVYKVNTIAITFALVFIMILTLCGNALVLLSFYAQPSLRRTIYLPIISLALADLLCALTAVPLYIVKQNHDGVGIVCDLYRFSYFFTEYASILSLMVISVERFLIIFNPMKYSNSISSRAIIVSLVGCWLEALFVSTLPFYWRKKNDENCTNSPTREWSIMVISVNVFAPFLIMFGCHGYIYAKALAGFYFKPVDGTKIKNRQGKSNQTGSGCKVIRENNWSIERKATISFSVVIGVFVVCWGPSTIYYFLLNVCSSCFRASYFPYEELLKSAMKLLTFCNSFVNPIIYFWLNIEFREAFQQICRREWIGIRSRSETVTSVNAIAIQPV